MSTTTRMMFFQLRFSIPIADNDDPTCPGIDFATALDLAAKAIMSDSRVTPFVQSGGEYDKWFSHFSFDKEKTFAPVDHGDDHYDPDL